MIIQPVNSIVRWNFRLINQSTLEELDLYQSTIIYQFTINMINCCYKGGII